MNIGTLIFLALGISMLFMGYPILMELYFTKEGNKGGFGLGGVNGTGQVPDMGKLVSSKASSISDLDSHQLFLLKGLSCQSNRQRHPKFCPYKVWIRA